MRTLKAILGAALAIVGFAACLAGLIYLVTTRSEHFPEPVAGVVEVKKKED